MDAVAEMRRGRGDLNRRIGAASSDREQIPGAAPARGAVWNCNIVDESL